MSPSEEQITAEIVGLHEDFEAWFHGTSASLDSVAAVLGEGFWFVGPAGMPVDRAGVLAFLQGGKGGSDVAIRIENVRVLWRRQDLAGVSYEEWQTTGDAVTGRVSSAVLEADEVAPRGLRWLSVHETWLPGQAPPDD